ncbi:sphingomyelin phosphodiesterase-like isoform X1 [Photinus pyralis]|uniref:sphingomyelin phosphodiesterase-like isoform X1 n=2 Tax=Photinus pyralis TaxID=7054 RepID=UPI0012670252|nr:sphingomyelin phosphodiesterase-like isoform X1 [Photinus pyralis]
MNRIDQFTVNCARDIYRTSSAAMRAVLFLLLIGGCLTENHADNWKSEFRRDLEASIDPNNRQATSLGGLAPPDIVQRWLASPKEETDESPLCEVCDAMVDVAITARKRRAGEELISEIFVKMCKWFELEKESFCESYVKNNIDIWLHIFDNKPALRSRTFCVYALHKHRCRDPERMDWTIELPPKPVSKNVAHSPASTTEAPLKILHLTDIHYDPDYEIGSNANCNDMLCCQKGTKPNTSADEAGYWGSYPCDTPWHAVEDVLHQVIEKHTTYDAIYFTGDIIKHSEWLTGIKTNTEEIIKVFDEFKAVFKGIPLFPTLGNHEPFPSHQFSSDSIGASSNLSTQWIYDLMGKSWETWLPEDALQTVFKGGYYTVLVKPGLRLIALNNNVAYTYNNWLYFDDNDPLGQLKWLVEVLTESEAKGEKVHIISHVPSNDMFCFYNWGKEYTRIVERFAHVIVGQFNGHSHDDDFFVYFNSQNHSEVVNVAYVGGSATTYTNSNPNYKIFDIDSNTYNVLNYETWIYNLTEANLTPKNPPRWYKLYDIKSAYGLPSLNPADFTDLMERMAKDPELLQKFHRYKKREADQIMAKGCNRKCELETMCYMVTTWFGEDDHCKHYTEIYNSNLPEN